MRSTFVFGCALAVAMLSASLSAAAQNYPPPPPGIGSQQPPPGPGPNGGPQIAPPIGGFHLRGVVTYSVPYFLTLDAGGSRVPVQLHVGTVILPTGLTLVAGMRVAINGYWIRRRWGRPFFLADRIVLIR
ncbi:MAG: hypothetical protein ACREMP_10155 [Candidatus Tyrphobacter sp.]